MDSKFFYLLLCLCLSPHAFGSEEEGNIAWAINCLGACIKGLKQGTDHFEDHGAGKQALKELAQKDATIERQGKSIEAVALAATNTPGSGDPAPAIPNTQNGNGTVNNNSDQTNTYEKFELACKGVTMAYQGAYVVKSGHDLYTFFYTWIWPNPEDQIRKDNAIKQLAILSAETQLNKCLARNMYKDRSGYEMPSQCEDVSAVFAEAAGQEALNKVKRALAETQLSFAETQLNKCLARNMYKDRSGYEMPSKCEDVSILFAEIAGSEALEKIMCQYSLLKKRVRRD